MADKNIRPFVTVNTQLLTSTLYTVKSRDAPAWPMNSQTETPFPERSLHCLAICAAIVASSTSELTQPTTSVNYSLLPVRNKTSKTTIKMPAGDQPA